MLPLPSPEPITILRYGAQTFASGALVTQTPTEIAAVASVQPSDDSVVITDPGYSGQERRRLFCYSEIRTANEHAGIPSDDVRINGEIWRVFSVDPWRGFGLIPAHWEAEIWLKQPIG